MEPAKGVVDALPTRSYKTPANLKSRMAFKKNTHCRYCRSPRLQQFISLGDQPPSNDFLRPDQIASERRYPLDVYLCEDCALAQLIDVVSGDSIFDDYAYLSSSSKALCQHYVTMAASLTTRYGLKAGDVVVDIGCNDGVLLKGYAPAGLVRVGIEPSKVADYAEQTGFEVVREFFGVQAARKIVAAHGPAAVVTATNVFAHVDDIHSFVAGIAPLLREDGVFVIESPYLVDMIEQCLFDTIYHEHLCYYSLTPMVPFFRQHGLEVVDVGRVNFGASGPAFRTVVAKRGSPHQPSPAVTQMLADEEAWGIRRLDRYAGFAQAAAGVKNQVLGMLRDLKARGATIGGFGAPAKGNTMLNYLGVTRDLVECVAENNPLKQGKVTPGTHLPIVSDEEFLRRMPDYALLLTWNYADFFLKHSEYIRRGGKFIVPLPKPRMAP